MIGYDWCSRSIARDVTEVRQKSVRKRGGIGHGRKERKGTKKGGRKRDPKKKQRTKKRQEGKEHLPVGPVIFGKDDERVDGFEAEVSWIENTRLTGAVHYHLQARIRRHVPLEIDLQEVSHFLGWIPF
jgi:hypothetical protein